MGLEGSGSAGQDAKRIVRTPLNQKKNTADADKESNFSVDRGGGIAGCGKTDS